MVRILVTARRCMVSQWSMSDFGVVVSTLLALHVLLDLQEPDLNQLWMLSRNFLASSNDIGRIGRGSIARHFV